MESRVEQLFQEALQRAESERAAYLAEMCGGDEALRQEVETLLLHDRRAGSGFLESPPIRLVEDAIRAEPFGPTGPAAEPRTVGPYQLIRKLGEGGMGQVWLAQQSVPLRRQVALKLIRAGCYDDSLIRRFESERQSLAMMDHPAIAKVFDAGATAEGQPYFVMEYVEGKPIDAYCDENKLTIRERLKLFMRVCDGVQHAHQKAIIHRDLKPSNILVTEVDGRPEPKIIDFGVAKALGQKLTEDTLFTRVGALIGTPEYISPEQAGPAGQDIDTRTDVYSLGAILYELLAGAPPLGLRRIALEEFLRRLREDEPAKPSTKIRTLDPAVSTEIGRKRQTEPAALVKQVRGDLDAIALKALEKDRSRRYGSPSEFAADIGRYLKHEAVLAVAPSAAYRARKFARRHRGALITASAFVVVLVAAAAVSIEQSVRANREAAAAHAVDDFLQNDLLAQASTYIQSPGKGKPDPDLKVRTALDRAAARISGKFDGQPEVEAAVRQTIGNTYMDLGQYQEATKHLQRALDLYRRTLGPDNPKTLEVVGRQARESYLEGKYPEAEKLFNQVIAVQRRVLGPESPDTLNSIANLGSVYLGEAKLKQAEELLKPMLVISRRVLGSEHRTTLAAMNTLAVVYADQGNYAQADPLYLQTYETNRRVFGPENPNTLMSLNNLASEYLARGDYARAEPPFTQLLEVQPRVVGPEHQDTLMTMINLATAYQGQGKFTQAADLLTKTLEVQERVLGPENRYSLMSLSNLSSVDEQLGRHAVAEALQKQALDIKMRVLGPKHPDTLLSMDNLAGIYTGERRFPEAEPLFVRTVEAARRALGSEHPYTLAFIFDFAAMDQRMAKYGEAENLGNQALAGRRHIGGSSDPDTMDSASCVALACLDQGKFAQSEALAREAVDFYRKNQPNAWQHFRAESLLGAALAGQKKYAEAEPLLLEGYQGLLAGKDCISVPDRYHLDRAHEWLVQLYQAWGKPTKAAEWRRK